MTRSSLTTVLLGGALAAACSKPNPLFLETWGGASDSGGVSESSATTVTTTPGTWTTATTGSSTEDEPPTTTSTATTWTPTSSSSDPEETETETTDAPTCSKKEIELEPAHDTFVIKKTDAGPTCGVTVQELFAENYCRFLDFGQQGALSSFFGEDQIDPQQEWLSAYMFRFPRDAEGRLLESGQGPAIPLTELVKANLRIAYSRTADELADSVTFKLYAIPPGVSWVEGAGEGSPCVEEEAPATFQCSQCAANAACKKDWFGGEFDLEKLTFIAEFDGPASTPEGATFDRKLENKWFGEVDNEGFVLVAAGVNGGKAVKPGMVRLHAKEYAGDAKYRPLLRVEVCK